MKTAGAFLFLTGLLFCLYGCKKDNNTHQGPLVGKWNVVSIESGGVTHVGQPGDYYEFEANGALNIKGGTATATVNYTMSADSTITLTFPADPGALAEWGRITTFTAHSLVINGLYPVSPGGAITEGSSINLSR